MASGEKILDCFKCQHCRSVFSKIRLPVSLPHSVVCQPCLKELVHQQPGHKILVPKDAESYPVNSTLMFVLNLHSNNNNLSNKFIKSDQNHANNIENILKTLSDVVFISNKAFNENLSKFVQKRLLQIININLCLHEGRAMTVKHSKLLVERIVTELVLSRQTSAHISSCLWSAVRARGCQFLGPPSQDAVLALIIKALQGGELIARKQLVLYIVDSMIEEFPNISKTCVGHVVQLLYRASCFNVIKRDGESSLMQLKEEFRDYANLRKEHDFQIVQIASEAGLRISPDQWSTLLYGDPFHRPQLEKTIERLNEPPTLTQNETAALQNILLDTQEHGDPDPDEYLLAISEILLFETNESISLADLNTLFRNLLLIVEKYSKIYKSKPIDPSQPRQKDPKQNGVVPAQRMYKTRFCRDVLVGRPCPRGDRCTYAHASNEMRANQEPPFVTATMNDVPPPLPPTQMAPIGSNLTQQPVDQLSMHFNDMLLDQPPQIQQPPPVLLASSDMEQPIVLDNGLAHAAAAAAANGQAPPVVVPVIMNHHDMNSGIVQPALTHALMFPNDDPNTGGTLVLPNASTPAVQPVPTTAHIQPIETQLAPVSTMADPNMLPQFSMMPNSVIFPNPQAPMQPMAQPMPQPIQPPQSAMLNQNGLGQLPQLMPSQPQFVNQNGLTQPPQMMPQPIQPGQFNQSIPQMNQSMPQMNQSLPPMNHAIPPGQFVPSLASVPLTTPVGPGFQSIPTLPTATVSTPLFFNNHPANLWLPPEPILQPYDYEHNGFNGREQYRSSSSLRFPDSIWQINDDQVLLARRNEIVSCLNHIREDVKPTEEEEECQSHVSYTVANSVLFDDMDQISNTNLELPPLPELNTLPITFQDTVVVPEPVFTFGGSKDLCRTHPIETSSQIRDKKESINGNRHSRMASYNSFSSDTPLGQSPISIIGSPPKKMSNSIYGTSPQNILGMVKTMCPITMFTNKQTAPATVQADCSVMNVKDMFERPLVISSLQRSHLPQASYESVDPINMVDHVPQVIRPLCLKSNPQHIVSNTLDKILNVKERINDVEKHGGAGSAVEKAQLKLELNIVNKQISSLDTATKQTCLLKELEAVDKKIEDMNVSV